MSKKVLQRQKYSDRYSVKQTKQMVGVRVSLAWGARSTDLRYLQDSTCSGVLRPLQPAFLTEQAIENVTAVSQKT